MSRSNVAALWRVWSDWFGQLTQGRRAGHFGQIVARPQGVCVGNPFKELELITRKSIVTFGFLGASSMLIALTALAGPASAQVSPPTGSSESPNPVQTSAQF